MRTEHMFMIWSYFRTAGKVLFDMCYPMHSSFQALLTTDEVITVLYVSPTPCLATDHML